VLDGGTQGLYLLPRVEAADHLLIIDAALPVDGAPKVKVYRNEDIKALLQPTVSAHQTGVHTLMAMARLHGKMPEEVALIAVPAVMLEMGTELSPELKALLPAVVDKAIEILSEWEDQVGEG
jgi:hydrogenase maturation protease